MKKFISNKFIVCMLCALVSGGSVFAGNWDGRSVARTERHAQKQVFRTGRMTAAICSPVDASAVAAQAAEDETVVLSENFDKFTAGSEEAPDMTNIVDSQGVIMQDYIQTYGWSGVNVFQAGGCCYLSDGKMALLATPVLDLSKNDGNFTVKVSFRAQSGSTNFYIAWGGVSGAIGRRYAAADTRWGVVEVPCTGGLSQTMIQFYGDAPVFIDDVEITQLDVEEEPSIAAPVPTEATDITETGFTANWNEVVGATSYLLDVFYFENNEQQYFLQDEEVTGISCPVTGLDASRLYFYTVQATDGTLVSEESSMVVVKEPSESVGTPVALAATEVTDDGFRANWTEVENAVYYQLATLSYYTVPASGEYVMEDEDFSGSTEGTPDNPVYNSLNCFLDEYTHYPNWEGVTTLMVDGMVALKNYYSIMGQYSMLYTPVYSVSGNTASGKIKVSVTVQKDADCSSATEFGVILVNNATGETAGDWQRRTFNNSTETFEFEFPACSSYYLVMTFGDENNSDYGLSGVVYIDDVKVTQELSAGSVVTRLYDDVAVYGGTSCYVATPDKRDGERFSYYVVAATNGAEETVVSSASNEVWVGGQGSVESVDVAGEVSVYGGAGNLVVVAAECCHAYVYDLAGRLVADFNVTEGENVFALEKGLYVVKVAGMVQKVAVR